MHLNVSLSSSHNLYNTPLSRMNIFSVILNSVPLSVRILELPPKIQYMCVLYVSQIAFANLSGIGMAILYPVSM